MLTLQLYYKNKYQMSFLAKLFLDGNVYNILEYHYNPTQEVDISGKPANIVRGGQITLTIESSKDKTFLNWALHPVMAKEGTITFYKRDAMSKLMEINFETAYCVHREENFSNKGTDPLSQTIKISPGRVIYQDVEHEEVWNVRKKDMSKASTFVPQTEEDKEKRVIMHFDASGSDIKNGKFGFDKFNPKFKKIYKGADFSKLENEYNPIQVYGEKYFPVWVSMRKGQTITLKIDEEKRKNYKLFNEIKFVDNPDFKFEPANLKDAKEVQITCNNPGSQTQIEVEGDGTVVGAVNFFYPEVKTVNLDWRFVEISGSKKDERKLIDKVDKVKLTQLLKKVFNPMLIDFNIENTTAKIIDLSKEKFAGILYKAGETEYILKGRKGSFVAITEKASPPSATSLTLYLANRICMDKENAAIEEGTYNAVAGFSETNSGIAYGILANTDGKILPEAIAHEIMHALGLEHTFELQKSHIFEGKSTDNYMDYSDSKIYTWKWQWEITRTNKLVK